MEIILLIRRDKEYWLHNRMSFNGVVDQKFEREIWKWLIVWNLFFKMRYIEFRKRLAEISSLSYPQNNFDDIIMYWDEDKLNSLEPGTLIVPMDDDDWFSPNLVKNLREIKEPCKGIYWDQYVKDISGRFEHRNRMVSDHIVDSCCYSLKTPCDYDFIKNHWSFSKDNLHYIPKRLAVKIESLACLSVLYQLDVNVSNCKKFIKEKLKEEIRSTCAIPEEYKHQIALYKDLLKELLESLI